jgi:branched-chain amino acid aminotransferase
MNNQIQIARVKESRLSEVDFGNIPFGRIFSDHMFVCDYRDGRWENPRIVPFGSFSIHPACMALHYGQAIFEGMKASKSHDGQPLLLRPEKHLHRLNASAARMSMPAFPEELFLEALHQLVGLDADWIPPQEGSALYIRPYMFATDEFIGVKPSDHYKMVIFTCPVGPYYPKPVKLWAETHYVRAIPGGTGEAKAAGNYAGALLPARLAQEKGYDQILWLDGHHFKQLQEVGTMNLFVVIDGKVITPATDGAILKGITRMMILEILRDKGIAVEERPITIDELVEAYQAGKLQEVFGSGTAAVVAHVSEVGYQDLKMVLPDIADRKIGPMVKAYIDSLRAGKIEDKFGWLVPVKEFSSVEA